MDTATLKALLAAQEQAYRGAMEVLSKQLSEQCRQLQATVQDLKTSLEYSQKEVDELKQQVNHLNQVNRSDKTIVSQLRNDFQSSRKDIEEMEKRCNYLDDYSRRQNLQFIGIPEDSNETWEQAAEKVSNLLATKFQLPDMQLDRAHRVGHSYPNRERPIVARFTRFCDREAVMRNVSKLRGSRIYINEDLCPASQQIKKAQLPLLKQARNEGKIAYFRHTKLIIKDRNNSVTGTNSTSNKDPHGTVVPDVTANITGGGADVSAAVAAGSSQRGTTAAACVSSGDPSAVPSAQDSARTVEVAVGRQVASSSGVDGSRTTGSASPAGPHRQTSVEKKHLRSHKK